MYMNILGVTTDWELDRNRLTVEESLGEGEFGLVKRGVYLRSDGSYMEVAVKLLKGEYRNCFNNVISDPAPCFHFLNKLQKYKHLAAWLA